MNPFLQALLANFTVSADGASNKELKLLLEKLGYSLQKPTNSCKFCKNLQELARI